MMRSFAFLFILILTFSCTNKLTTTGLKEDYDDFYARFHDDPEFQLSRVKFPLGGAYEDAEGITIWNQSNWVFQEGRISEINQPGYDTEEVRTDYQVIEKVQLQGAGYESERRFQLVDGKWYLVYFDTVNL